MTTVIVLLTMILTVGCNSTPKSHIAKIEKRPLLSDHHLMMSLLNRPMTQDQKMMLAFSKQQDSYQSQTPTIFVNTIFIKGEKTEQPATNSQNNYYQHLIAKDINSVRVSGPY